MAMTPVDKLVGVGIVPEQAKRITEITKDKVANVATVGTADASDLDTAIALSNALKARLNELITALKA